MAPCYRTVCSAFSPGKAVPACTLVLACLNSLPAATGHQILLRNFDPADGVPRVLTADNRGRLFAISTLNSTSRAVELDLNGARLAALDLPQLSSPAAAATDSQGNVIVAGHDVYFQGVILKLDPQLRNVLFSRSLPAVVNAAAIDSAGNIYVTGVTSSTAFPVTPDAYQTRPPLIDTFGRSGYAFLTKMSPAGDLLYSTYFGDDRTLCLGGSFCVGKYAVTTGTAIAVDASGAVVIAGSTTASNLPTTPGALAATCACGYNYAFGTGVSSGFLARFQPGGARQLQWSTYLNAAFTRASVSVTAIALDSAGNVVVAGSAPSGLPTTPGALQPSTIDIPDSATAFLLKLNNSATGLVWGTYFGDPDGAALSFYLDAQGEVVFAGYRSGPPVYFLFRQTYVGRLSSDASTLIHFYEGPATDLQAGVALTKTPSGGFAALAQSGALWIETAAPGPSLLNVADSASGLYSSSVAPQELISLYGLGIGPQTPANGQVLNDAFTSSVAGYQVLFDGRPAPLIYAGSGQINAVAPRAISTATHIQIVTPGGLIDGPTLPVAVRPAIFRDNQTGLAVAVNQDGSVNTLSNPARAGAIVTVYVTGAGSGPEFFPDGAIVPLDIYDWAGPVWALTTNRSLELSFAGYAPGIVAGVIQVNFRVPDWIVTPGTLPFNFQFNGVSTIGSQIAVAP